MTVKIYAKLKELQAIGANDLSPIQILWLMNQIEASLKREQTLVKFTEDLEQLANMKLKHHNEMALRDQ